MEKFLAAVRKIVPSGIADAVRPAYHFVLAVIGEVAYGFPGRKLTVIGITGTKGKSTTAVLTASVLEAGGKKVGLLSTVEHWIGGQKTANPSDNTSLGRFGTYRMLRKMAKVGCTHAVLEVSSHAMHWHRMWAVPFQTAVFTNFSKDHLDLHKTMENYRAAKLKLFARLKSSTGSVAVVNGDDAAADQFLKCLADHKYVFGITPRAADVLPLAHTVLADNVKTDASGSAFTVKTDEQSFPVRLKLPGAFNVSNALAAISVGLAHGLEPNQITTGIEAIAGVSGRMEPVEAGQPFKLIVDFAHTPASFENVLAEIRKFTTGQLISVFGAPGGRDKSKFPDMGEAAGKYSDRILLTEDDPRTEDPAELAKLLIEGIERGKKVPYEVEADRRKAISKALAQAKAGDTVVLLAKGHQRVMYRGTGTEPWDDREVAAEEWQKLGK